VIGLVAAGPGGRLAGHLAASWPDARLYGGAPRDALASAWSECDGLVLFMAVGAAVRLVAPLLADKRIDPGVVCVDDAGRFAVALAGSHEGGANALAARVADALGAVPIVTTASDLRGIPALESFGADLGFRLDPASDLAAVAAALVSGERVRLACDRRWPLPALPETVVPASEPEPPCIVVSDRAVRPPRPAVVYRPPSLVVGVGCSRGADAAEVESLIEEVLADAGLARESVALLATLDAKRDEPGLLEVAARRGWALAFHSAESLARRPVPNPSAAVASAVGTPSVAEAAVLAEGAELLVAKRRSRAVTVAVGRLPARGRLFVVGLGPGSPDLLPPMARRALARASTVVGLDRYVAQARPFLRPGTTVLASPIGAEVSRAELALAEARAGSAVALVSGGDAGVYGMASPLLERASDDVDVEIVPGVTAANAAAALLGSPLGHDHCAISLSDLLTPWPEIRRRLEAAAEADFVVVLYNPRSSRRTWQLEEARRLLLERRSPDTPVGLVTDAYRPGQRVRITTLGALDARDVRMTTTVVVGSTRTRLVGGRMVTPRGRG
jgi:cobalt-precorrin 5A hydrolase/precorrin-3B C17-methyltransferase